MVLVLTKADNLNFVLVESDNKTSCERSHCVQIQGIVTHGYSFGISESSSRFCCCHQGTVGRRFQLPSRCIHITFAFADCWATRSLNSYDSCIPLFAADGEKTRPCRIGSSKDLSIFPSTHSFRNPSIWRTCRLSATIFRLAVVKVVYRRRMLGEEAWWIALPTRTRTRAPVHAYYCIDVNTYFCVSR